MSTFPPRLIVETDLGHDPDDFFAICWLIAAGVQIDCVAIVPGAPDQVALAELIRRATGQSFTIGVAKPTGKLSSGDVITRSCAAADRLWRAAPTATERR